jgi:hypothetical protein
VSDDQELVETEQDRDALIVELQERAQEQVVAARKLTEYCDRLHNVEKLSFRVIGDALGLGHTVVWRAVAHNRPLNVLTTALRRGDAA